MRFFRNLAVRRKKENDPPTSVRDYGDTASLQRALDGKGASSIIGSTLSKPQRPTSSKPQRPADALLTAPVEWKLSLVDAKTSRPQTMEDELKRLQVLQSYFILDSERDSAFDQITQLASKTFDTPIALVSLVDLGRQWFLSKVGLDASETPRQHSFCAHVVISKVDMMIIPDATDDIRFKDNPLVIGAPHIRFYAGAALVSPEGIKLGTLCIISPKKRPQGLNSTQKEMLKHMADIVVNTMVARRDRMIKVQYEEKLTTTCSMLLDASDRLVASQRELEETIEENADNYTLVQRLGPTSKDMELHSKTVQATIRNLQKDLMQQGFHEGKQVRSNSVAGRVSHARNAEAVLADIMNPKTDICKLFENINTILQSFPRPYPITLELDESAPTKVVAVDLLLFRSTMNLITHAMERTAESTGGSIHMKISASHEEIIFECEDSGPNTGSLSRAMFHENASHLAPIASMVRSMDGTYGCHSGMIREGVEGRPMAIFWFKVPLDDITEDSSGSFIPVADIPKVEKTLLVHHQARTNSVVASNTVMEMAEDPFRDAVLQSGCGSRN